MKIYTEVKDSVRDAENFRTLSLGLTSNGGTCFATQSGTENDP